MAEQKKMILLQVEEKPETVTFQFAPDDLSFITDVALWRMNWNADKKKGEPNEETYAKYVDNLQEYLGVSDDMDEINALVGKEFDLWESKGKFTFWKPLTLAKAPESAIGDLWQATVVAIREYESMIQVVIETDEMPDEQLGIKFNWGTYIASKKISIPNPANKINAEKRFNRLTGLTLETASELVGRSVMVEVKENQVADGTYLDLKKSKA